MKLSIFLLISLFEGISCHYVFSHLLVNGTSSGNFTYIRDVATPDSDDGWATKYDPQYGNDMHTNNITCGRLAWRAAPRTETATVLAGSQVGFRVWETNGWIGHEGPAQIYMAKAPSNLENWTGDDGNWFKIAYVGPLNDTTWKVTYQTDVNFTIPTTTPPGKYLLRIEHIWPSQTVGYTQFYVNCAHINVVGPGGGTPTSFAKFPGSYKDTDPGILVSREMAYAPAKELLKYTPPGPAVWTG